MKKACLHSLQLVILGLFFVSGGTALAEAIAPKSASEAFQYSLMSLKDSAKKVAERNEWLAVESERLRIEIQSLQGDIDALEQEKRQMQSGTAQLDDVLANESKEVMVAEKKTSRLKKDMKDLLNQQEALQGKIDVKRRVEQDVQEMITANRQEIKQIENKIQSLVTFLESDEANPEKAKLLQSLEDNEKTLARLKKEYQQIRNRHTKPLRMMQELIKQEDALKQKLNILENELKAAVEEDRQVHDEIEQLKKKKESRLSKLLEDIQQLRSRYKELAKTLSQARKKIEGQDIDFAKAVHQTDQLEKDLTTLREESVGLRKEISTLENKLETLTADETD